MSRPTDSVGLATISIEFLAGQPMSKDRITIFPAIWEPVHVRIVVSWVAYSKESSVEAIWIKLIDETHPFQGLV